MAQSDIANEILPGLWLGNVKASMDENFIRRNNIQVVFNCTKNLPFSSMIPIKYRIPVDDNLEEDEIRNLELWSNEIAFKIIAEYRNGHHILIHCMAGMQRSAASLAMMMIAHLQLRAPAVMQMIRAKRPIAFYPNANFGRSIQTFDQRFHTEILPAMKKLSSHYKSE
jgi:predicted ATP-dependent Lon-type protease